MKMRFGNIAYYCIFVAASSLIATMATIWTMKRQMEGRKNEIDGDNCSYWFATEGDVLVLRRAGCSSRLRLSLSNEASSMSLVDDSHGSITPELAAGTNAVRIGRDPSLSKLDLLVSHDRAQLVAFGNAENSVLATFGAGDIASASWSNNSENTRISNGILTTRYVGVLNQDLTSVVRLSGHRGDGEIELFSRDRVQRRLIDVSR